MTRKKWESEVRLCGDTETADEAVPQECDPDRKLVIGVLGDFLGHAGDRGTALPLPQRKFHNIDRDNFDEVLARLGVRWHGKVEGTGEEESGGSDVELVFRELEDFHPDSIMRRLPALDELHGMLEALEDSRRFAETADRVERLAGVRRPDTEPAREPKAQPGPVAGGAGLLDAILDRQEGSRPATSDFDRFVEEIAAPHLERVDRGRRRELVETVHRLLSQRVRSVLHDPSFRSLESLWRSLRRLVDSCASDTVVRIVQLRKEELSTDIASGRDLESSGLAGLLLDRAAIPGGLKFSFFVAAYEFSHDLEDLVVLERLGNIGARLRAPFVGAAGPALFGCRSFSGLPAADEIERLFDREDYRPWRLLRQTAPARWLALAAPRWLCRLPYGSRSDGIESFPFEEICAGGSHEALVWGNPAFAVAEVFAGSFAVDGWQMNPAASVVHLQGLPLYMYRAEGETVAMPCAEVLIGERTAEAIMDAGVLTLLSHRDADVVSVPSLQTLAHPRAPLRLPR